MDRVDEYMPQFLKPSRSTVTSRYSRGEAQKLFWRLGDEERLELTFRLLALWCADAPVRRPAVAEAFREALDSEPFLPSGRRGSYLTEAVIRQDKHFPVVLEDLLFEWGRELMNVGEKRRLAAMKFPLTVFRGGVGDLNSVADGMSWTLDLKVATFFATEWPKRSGDQGPPIVVSTVVDRDDVVAFLNERNEQTILIPYPDDICAEFQLVEI